jgi:protein NrfD
MDSTVVYNTPHFLYWDWRIAADLFFGGIGVGAFLLAVLNSLYYKDKFPRASKIAAIISPFMVILGLVFMLSELGHPWRLFNTLTGFNISSPLSWGGIFQPLFVAVGLVYAYLWLKPGKSNARNLVGIVGIPLALIVGAYHGWLLSIVRARPLWNTGPSMIAAVLGFATTGMAAVLLLMCILPHRRVNESGESRADSLGNAMMFRDFRNALVVGLGLQCLTFFVWWISLIYGSTGSLDALRTAYLVDGPLFLYVGIGLGLVVPAVLLLAETVLKPGAERPVSKPLAAVSAVLILVGGFVFRYAVVMGGQLS